MSIGRGLFRLWLVLAGLWSVAVLVIGASAVSNEFNNGKTLYKYALLKVEELERITPKPGEYYTVSCAAQTLFYFSGSKWIDVIGVGRNVVALINAGAEEKEITNYLKSQGMTFEQLQNAPMKLVTDPALLAELNGNLPQPPIKQPNPFDQFDPPKEKSPPAPENKWANSPMVLKCQPGPADAFQLADSNIEELQRAKKEIEKSKVTVGWDDTESSTVVFFVFMAIFPPFFVLLIGLSFLWAIRGFKRE